MPGLVALVTAISQDVVSKLASAGYPALTDGGIVVGWPKQFENSAPPRIIMVPVRSRYEHKTFANRSNVTATQPWLSVPAPGAPLLSIIITQEGLYSSPPTVVITGGGGVGATAVPIMAGTGVAAVQLTNRGTGYTTPPSISFTGGGGTVNAAAYATIAHTLEQVTMLSNRVLKIEWVEFEVHCWGIQHQASQLMADVLYDFDSTQALAQQVLASCQYVAPNFWNVKNGAWTTGKPGNTQLLLQGQEFVFGLELCTPVVDQLIPIVGAPGGQGGVGTLPNQMGFLNTTDGSPPERGF